MQIKRRWMRAALEAASGRTPRLPWERGLRRQAMIARRMAAEPRPVRRPA